MAIARRQNTHATNAGASPATLAFVSDVLAGSAVIVAAEWNNETDTPTVTDSQSNTYTLAELQAVTGAGISLGVWTTPNTSAGALTVTITEAGASFDFLFIEEVTGQATSSVVDVTADDFNLSAASPASSSNTAAMSQNNGLVFGVFACGADLTEGSGFTSRADASNLFFYLAEDKVVTGGGVQAADASYTGTQAWAAICVVLKEVVASGVFARPNADVSDGSWTASTGTDLYAMIDEASVNDADYIRSSASPSSDTAEVQLSPIGGPPGAGDVTIVVRHKTT